MDVRLEATGWAEKGDCCVKYDIFSSTLDRSPSYVKYIILISFWGVELVSFFSFGKVPPKD